MLANGACWLQSVVYSGPMPAPPHCATCESICMTSVDRCWPFTAGGSNQPSSRSEIIATVWRSEEHTSELQSLMRISYAVFCLKKKTRTTKIPNTKLPSTIQQDHEPTE